MSEVRLITGREGAIHVQLTEDEIKSIDELYQALPIFGHGHVYVVPKGAA